MNKQIGSMTVGYIVGILADIAQEKAEGLADLNAMDRETRWASIQDCLRLKDAVEKAAMLVAKSEFERALPNKGKE